MIARTGGSDWREGLTDKENDGIEWQLPLRMGMYGTWDDDGNGQSVLVLVTVVVAVAVSYCLTLI